MRAASVSNALSRLSDLGLVNYERREYVTLTDDGERQGRRVYARHQLLMRFFEEVLSMPADKAEEQACAMEHSLSDEGMDRFVRFFEFLGVCPSAPADLLERFRRCPIVQDDAPSCSFAEETDAACGHHCKTAKQESADPGTKIMAVSQLAPGELARVTRVDAQGAIRQRLLDMGILPNAEVCVERVGPTGDPVWIKVQGSQLALRRNEADAVQVAVQPVAE